MADTYQSKYTGAEIDARLGEAEKIAPHMADKLNPHEVTKAQVGLGDVDNTPDATKPLSNAAIVALAGKVDKVAGKGLSANDYTDQDRDKLAGIEEGAEVNPEIVDNLISDDATKVLSAKQGKVLQDGKISKTAIVNGLTETAEGKVLDARQGKALKDDIDGKVSKMDVVNTLTETAEGKVLDASQGKALKDDIDGKVSKMDVVNTLTETAEGKVLDARQGKALADLVSTNVGDLETLTTTDKSSLVNATNEVKNLVDTNSQPFHYDHVQQKYINVDKFWESLKNGKIYTSEFNQPEISLVTTGTKKDDNVGMVCEPSTNTVKGRNDYENIGLFMSIDVNAYIDENDDYHIKAIKGDRLFQKDGSMGDVYVMSMVGYQKRYATDEVWGISYSDTLHPGFEILQEAVKPDNTIRPFLLHAKYVAGRNPYENNNLASISGVRAEYVDMSHNGQIIEFGKKGSQYSGKTTHDDYYVQLMMWIKYAVTSSDVKMKGCQSYYLQYTNLVPETNVNRVIITNTQANALLVGSTVSIGDYGEGSISTDRQLAQNYNKANRVNITSIEDLGDGNSAVYVDSELFDTTLTTTITTYPWNSGGCDDVLGSDGSPYNPLSGKEPFVINGIEMMVGGYEVIQNLIIHNDAADNRTDVYVNYDCKTYSTSPTAAYELIGQIATTNNAWQYGSKMVTPEGHPSVILVTETNGSSTTGTGDGIYTDPPSNGGYQVWLSLGSLSSGAPCGFRCLFAYFSLALAHWSILGRLSATGRSRRPAGVN
jgi:hypothetical protein